MKLFESVVEKFGKRRENMTVSADVKMSLKYFNNGECLFIF